MKVKICGITNKDDATWALNYGADIIGINFYKGSPRHISLANAEKWVTQLPSFAQTVGVFVNAESKDIVKCVAKLKLKGIQLHGDETPEQVSALKKEISDSGHSPYIIKALGMKDEESLTQLQAYAPFVDYFLLDAYVEGEVGGTGKQFNWDLAVKAKELGKPIFLAGGLNPENVKEAVKKVQPFAVDVASGVEKSPKKKDPEKIKGFVTNAKN